MPLEIEGFRLTAHCFSLLVRRAEGANGETGLKDEHRRCVKRVGKEIRRPKALLCAYQISSIRLSGLELSPEGDLLSLLVQRK